MQAARGTSLREGDTAGPEPSSGRLNRPLGLFVGVVVLVYAFDVASKVLAVEALTDRAPIEILGPLLSLSLVRNPGAAFSAATGYTEVLTVVALVAVGVIVWVSRRLGSTGWAIGLGCLLGGVLGNLTDRLFRSPGPFRGHVVDFFMLPNFPVFNLADISINIAAGVIIVQALRGVRVDGSRHRPPRAGSKNGQNGEAGER